MDWCRCDRSDSALSCWTWSPVTAAETGRREGGKKGVFSRFVSTVTFSKHSSTLTAAGDWRAALFLFLGECGNWQHSLCLTHFLYLLFLWLYDFSCWCTQVTWEASTLFRYSVGCLFFRPLDSYTLYCPPDYFILLFLTNFYQFAKHCPTFYKN